MSVSVLVSGDPVIFDLPGEISERLATAATMASSSASGLKGAIVFLAILALVKSIFLMKVVAVALKKIPYHQSLAPTAIKPSINLERLRQLDGEFFFLDLSRF